MSAQCKLIDMTDISPKAKRPALPKLNTIADLLVCVDNLISWSIRVFQARSCRRNHTPKILLTWKSKRDLGACAAKPGDCGAFSRLVERYVAPL